MLDGFERGGLVSKKELDRIFDARIEAIALERIKSAGESKFITHEELKARLSIDD